MHVRRTVALIVAFNSSVNIASIELQSLLENRSLRDRKSYAMFQQKLVGSATPWAPCMWPLLKQCDIDVVMALGCGRQ